MPEKHATKKHHHPRAFLKAPRILLFDEATSALDAKTEKEVLESLAALAAGRTSLFVAHRLSTAAQCDQIVVLDAGRVAEAGSHAGERTLLLLFCDCGCTVHPTQQRARCLASAISLLSCRPLALSALQNTTPATHSRTCLARCRALQTQRCWRLAASMQSCGRDRRPLMTCTTLAARTAKRRRVLVLLLAAAAAAAEAAVEPRQRPEQHLGRAALGEALGRAAVSDGSCDAGC